MSANPAIVVNDDPLAGLTREQALEIVREQATANDALRIEIELLRGVNLERRMSEGCGPIRLRHIADIVAEHRETEWLVHHILERSVLAVLAGPRSTFKSFIALHWAMTSALNGFQVVILSGEGAGLGRRVEAWMRTHGSRDAVPLLPVLALERVLHLNWQDDLDALKGAIADNEMTPALVVVDTFSKFAPGLDENSNSEVAAFLARLSMGIREAYNCTVLLVAHTGHTKGNRPRGASSLMANTDAEYIVTRTGQRGMAVTVSRDRFKDCAEMPALAYEAQVIDLGRTDKYGDPVTSLALHEVGSKPPLKGKAQLALHARLTALEAGSTERITWSIEELRAAGREAGLSKGSARSAAEAVADSTYMTKTANGYQLRVERLKPVSPYSPKPVSEG